jgi:peptidyl-prolyl cis-trans isomerase C
MAVFMILSTSIGAQTIEGADNEPTPETTQATPEPMPSADTIMVMVDDTPITLGELIAVRQTLPEQYQQLPDELLMKILIEQMADQQLLATAGLEVELDKTRVVELALLNQKRAVLADAYMARAMVEGVTEDTLRAAYEANYVNSEPVTEMRASHILVAEQETAKELKEKLDGGGDFAALAAEFGTDGTASRGGDMGWFSAADVVPEFAKAISAMEAGTISDPVETPFGWHLIKLDEKRDRPIPPIEAVQAELISSLTEQVQKDVLQKLRSEANIVVQPAAGQAHVLRDDTLIVE